MELKGIRKYILGFGVLVLSLVVTAFLSAANLSSATNLAIDLISLQEVVQASEEISRAMEDERIAIGQYPLTGNEDLLTRIEDDQKTFEENWEVIVRNLGQDQAQLIDDLEKAHNTYKGLLNDVITEYQSNPGDNDSADRLKDAINYYLQYVNPKFSALTEPELAKLTARIEQEKTTIARRQAGAVIIFVLSVLVGVGVIVAVTGVMILSRRVIQSITQIVDAANAISRGDLDVPIDVEQGGEMGELAKAIDRMRTSLKAAIERLRR